MSASSDAEDAKAWVDERHLGRFIRTRYGRDAETVEIRLVRFLAREGFGALYRRDRYRDDGARLGPDLKVPLETAALVVEIFAAAHLAALRVLASDDAGMPLRHVQLDEVLDLLLEAGCEPPTAP